MQHVAFIFFSRSLNGRTRTATRILSAMGQQLLLLLSSAIVLKVSQAVLLSNHTLGHLRGKYEGGGVVIHAFLHCDVLTCGGKDLVIHIDQCLAQFQCVGRCDNCSFVASSATGVPSLAISGQ